MNCAHLRGHGFLKSLGIGLGVWVGCHLVGVCRVYTCGLFYPVVGFLFYDDGEFVRNVCDGSITECESPREICVLFFVQQRRRSGKSSRGHSIFYERSILQYYLYLNGDLEVA